MRTQRSPILLVLVVLLVAITANAQSLNVRLEGNQLNLVAPSYHFLEGDVLRRLHDGASVAFLFRTTVSMTRSSAPQNAVMYRFVVSYDLWEEKFAVTRSGTDPRAISHLSQSAAEKWVLDSLALPLLSLPAESPFWITVEYRMEQVATAEEESSFTLGRLIDLFSQRTDKNRSTTRKEITGGPYRLPELRRTR